VVRGGSTLTQLKEKKTGARGENYPKRKKTGGHTVVIFTIGEEGPTKGTEGDYARARKKRILVDMVWKWPPKIMLMGIKEAE